MRPDLSSVNGSRAAAAAEWPTALRKARIRKGLTQRELARRAGMHRNSILKLENGTTREVTGENAAALSRVLGASAADLGLHVRRSGPPPSIRLRKLTPEQREILAEVLALTPEEFTYVREAITTLREEKRRRQRGRRS